MEEVTRVREGIIMRLYEGFYTGPYLDALIWARTGVKMPYMALYTEAPYTEARINGSYRSPYIEALNKRPYIEAPIQGDLNDRL
jgi:hypothetical protein